MILLFGPPGAGKSVQGQLLAASHRWRWLSVGQILRDLKDPQVLEQMQRGEFIDEATIRRALEHVISSTDGATKLILDGYPRKVDQAQWLIAHLPSQGRSIDAAIVLHVPEEEIKNRLRLRGRLDDTDEIIQRRITQYDQELPPILQIIQQNAIPIIRIDGYGDVKAVHTEIEEKLADVYNH